MKYRNEKTNAVIDVKSKISGGYWKEEKIEGSSGKKEKQVPAKKKEADKEDE